MTRSRRISLNLGVAVSGLIAVLGGAWGGGKQVVSIADARYVQTDSFAAFQAGEALRHRTDSLTLVAEMKDVRRYLAGLDSSDRCNRGQRGFCR